jgi:GTP cyclohydrolase I
MEMEEIRQRGLRDNKKIQQAIRTILKEIGEDPDREGLQRTPYRVAKAYEEWFGGYGKDPKEVLNRSFTEKYNNMVIVKDINYYSHCEHHLAPFYGKVSIAYIPNGYVTGLDKLVKLVEIYSRRLQIQERMTDQIADAINKVLKPKGVIVVVTGIHLCMRSRETRSQDSVTVTSAVRGECMNDTVKQEALRLMGVE